LWLKNSQVKNVKASTLAQGKFTTKLEERRKDKQEKFKQEKAKPNLN